MFALSSAIAFMMLPLTPAQSGGGWHTDYAIAQAEARKTGKPLMIVFRCQP